MLMPLLVDTSTSPPLNSFLCARLARLSVNRHESARLPTTGATHGAILDPTTAYLPGAFGALPPPQATTIRVRVSVFERTAASARACRLFIVR